MDGHVLAESGNGYINIATAGGRFQTASQVIHRYVPPGSVGSQFSANLFSPNGTSTGRGLGPALQRFQG